MSDQMFEDAQQETISRIQFMKMRRSGVPVESVTAVMMPVYKQWHTFSIHHSSSSLQLSVP